MMINNMPAKRVIMVHQPSKKADYSKPPKMMISGLVKAKSVSASDLGQVKHKKTSD